MALIRDSKWANPLREGRFEEFNRLAAQESPDLRNADLRMLDLRQADLTRADLRGAYLRNADLRGLDLSGASMAGASLHDAKVAGVLFPAALPAEEISLSLTSGTRMRARCARDPTARMLSFHPRPLIMRRNGYGAHQLSSFHC